MCFFFLFFYSFSLIKMYKNPPKIRIRINKIIQRTKSHYISFGMCAFHFSQPELNVTRESQF